MLGKLKVIRIVVQQTYEYADKVSLPFYEYAEKMLKYAGLRAVEGDAKGYDATLSIEAKGIPRTAYYDGTVRWTSATVNGTISLSVSDKTFKWNFSGEKEPPLAIRQGSHSTPNDAPFHEAFDMGFTIALLELLPEIKDISSLVAVLKDENFRVRDMAASVLGRLKEPRAVEPLISALKYEEAFAREAAARLLGLTDDPRAVVPLIAALQKQNEKPSVRLAAAYSLGWLEDAHAVEPLISALKHEDPWVRVAAAHALEKITGKRFGEDDTKWQSWWQENKGRFVK